MIGVGVGRHGLRAVFMGLMRLEVHATERKRGEYGHDHDGGVCIAYDWRWEMVLTGGARLSSSAGEGLGSQRMKGHARGAERLRQKLGCDCSYGSGPRE